MDHLYVEICAKNNEKIIQAPLETLIIYFIYKHCECASLKLNFVLRENVNDEPFVSINIVDTECNVMERDNLPPLATSCVLPTAIINNVVVISGMCSVARQIIKTTTEDHVSRKLLGFREACLMACNESSVWTKFCEIDMIQTIKKLLQNPDVFCTNDSIHIPKDLSRFEYHMSQPVRIHNIYKAAQDQAKQNNKNSTSINCSIPKENLELPHLYGEGPYMTLADIILYPLIHIAYKFYKNIFIEHLPLTLKWYKNILNEVNLIDIHIPCSFNSAVISNKIIEQDEIQKVSLYISDPLRYKPRNRNFTKQPDIANALDIVQLLPVEIQTSEKPYGSEIEFDWSKVPQEAHPEGGALPKSRAKRKLEQLENLLKAVTKIAQPNQTIVDFCSGSGHLGILLAVNLPICNIILLENKEISLARAKRRVEKLALQNVTLLQCNLDYFIGKFDIGVSLHACGVATDLVIQHCIKQNAAFVSCPCCYGGVHVCHHLTYPRSQLFINSALTLKDYLVLGHAADQTHDHQNAKTKQGIICMDIIDTDRKLHAEEFGYKVTLSKMIPVSCTPKNNILVGIPKMQVFTQVIN